MNLARVNLEIEGQNLKKRYVASSPLSYHSVAYLQMAQGIDCVEKSFVPPPPKEFL